MLKLFVMSYTRNYQHIIFCTKNREKTIREDTKRMLFAYIVTVCNNMGAKVDRINTYYDHLHLLVEVPSTISVADFVKSIKQKSSAAFNRSVNMPLFQGWGKGYAAFSVSQSQRVRVREYIMNQEEHHRVKTFHEEYSDFLRANGFEPDEWLRKE